MPEDYPDLQNRQVAPARQSNRSLKQTVYSLLIIGGALLLVFGAPWISHLIIRGRWPEFEKELGYGLDHLGLVVIAAMVLRVTIEGASQREFISFLNDRVKAQIQASISTVADKSIKPLEQTINKLNERLEYRIATLDDKSLQVLKEKVLNPAFSRPQYNLELRLEPFKNPTSDLLRVFVGLSYEVRNISGKTACYTIESWLDDVIQLAALKEADRSHFTRVAYEKRPLGDADDRDIGNLKQKGYIGQGDGMKTVHIPYDVESDSHLYVAIEGYQLMRNEDHFVWNLVTITEKFTVTVKLLGNLTRENFDVFPHEMHHIEHEEFKKNQQWQDNKLTITINQVTLPFQGIEIRWSPHPPAPPEPRPSLVPVSPEPE